MKIFEWRKFIDDLGLNIEADPSKVGKKKVFIFFIGSIPIPSYRHPHMERHNFYKWFNLVPPKICIYQLTKNISNEIAPQICSGMRGLFDIFENIYLLLLLLLWSGLCDPIAC